MLCEKCGKNHATTHIKTAVNGVAKEYNLCSDCAAQIGYGGSISGMLASLLGESASKTKKQCSFCGTTFGEIAKSGRVGCGQCYSTFKDELLPYIKRIHGATNHIGNMPTKACDINPSEISVSNLKQELAELIKEEKYEQAAVVRDKIKEIEASINEQVV